jgi:CheY-like chemotaxis protein
MGKTKVLIVEDEVISAAALRLDLEDLGYEICSLASSADKAIEIAENEHPDVVLMDVRIQGEIDGIETAKRIRSRFGVRSIFMTGYPDEKEKVGDTEAYEYFVKPVEGIEIKEAIESIIKESKEDLGKKKDE